jgi:hypothetical protein
MRGSSQRPGTPTWAEELVLEWKAGVRVSRAVVLGAMGLAAVVTELAAVVTELVAVVMGLVVMGLKAEVKELVVWLMGLVAKGAQKELGLGFQGAAR